MKTLENLKTKWKIVFAILILGCITILCCNACCMNCEQQNSEHEVSNLSMKTLTYRLHYPSGHISEYQIVKCRDYEISVHNTIKLDGEKNIDVSPSVGIEIISFK